MGHGGNSPVPRLRELLKSLDPKLLSRLLSAVLNVLKYKQSSRKKRDFYTQNNLIPKMSQGVKK